MWTAPKSLYYYTRARSVDVKLRGASDPDESHACYRNSEDRADVAFRPTWLEARDELWRRRAFSNLLSKLVPRLQCADTLCMKEAQMLEYQGRALNEQVRGCGRWQACGLCGSRKSHLSEVGSRNWVGRPHGRWNSRRS
eukprot:5076503-Prymnesium_polylepis.1